MEAGSSQVKGHPLLHSDFKANLEYAESSFNTKKEHKTMFSACGIVAQWVKAREGTSTI